MSYSGADSWRSPTENEKDLINSQIRRRTVRNIVITLVLAVACLIGTVVLCALLAQGVFSSSRPRILFLSVFLLIFGVVCITSALVHKRRISRLDSEDYLVTSCRVDRKYSEYMNKRVVHRIEVVYAEGWRSILEVPRRIWSRLSEGSPAILLRYNDRPGTEIGERHEEELVIPEE